MIMSGNEAWNRNVLDADGRLLETAQISRVDNIGIAYGTFHISECRVSAHQSSSACLIRWHKLTYFFTLLTL